MIVNLNGKIISGRLAKIFANRNIGKVVGDTETKVAASKEAKAEKAVNPLGNGKRKILVPVKK
jgi:hypothetical protein